MWQKMITRTGQVGPNGKATPELKALLAATAGTLLGLVLQMVAVSTNSWLLLELPNKGLYRNATGRHLVEAYSGLWKICRVEVLRTAREDGSVTESEHTECQSHNLFPSEDEIQRNKDYDQHHLGDNCGRRRSPHRNDCGDYTRTAIAFTIIALVITIIGHSFAIYSLRRPRYIIKRLAALLHFMTAACLLVLNEVFVKTVNHEKENMPERIPREAETSYGFSFVLSWIVFVMFVLAGLVFLIYSRKKKAEYADGEDLEDEPMQLGRR
ncbi:voltage-dependent calcium channel gamma-1 subunit-like [Littorina saxatilis]|uniref:voltage-dependent calcium channel gamma-1 subunit-like n=1 Tax=Littorina saxatilis TaxID=31220 RepID=UPI0038B42D4C